MPKNYTNEKSEQNPDRVYLSVENRRLIESLMQDTTRLREDNVGLKKDIEYVKTSIALVSDGIKEINIKMTEAIATKSYIDKEIASIRQQIENTDAMSRAEYKPVLDVLKDLAKYIIFGVVGAILALLGLGRL